MGAEVESFLSIPARYFKSIALSFTVFVMGPIWSRDDPKAISPYRETLPYVGLSPVTLHNPAGCLIDPPVSDPKAATHISAATAAADPPEDPPGTLDKSHGLQVVW